MFIKRLTVCQVEINQVSSFKALIFKCRIKWRLLSKQIRTVQSDINTIKTDVSSPKDQKKEIEEVKQTASDHMTNLKRIKIIVCSLKQI